MSTYQSAFLAARAAELKNKMTQLGINCEEKELGKFKITSALTPQAVENQLISIEPTMRINLEAKGMGTEGTVTFADIVPLNE